MTCRRFEKALPIDHIFVATNELYCDIVQEQLPHLPPQNILCESQNRNTASTIAFVAMHLHSLHPDAIVAITPSDHLITDDTIFQERIEQAFRCAQKRDMIVTLGIKPTYPEVGYGYIQAEEMGTDPTEIKDENCFKVKTFIEKPNHEMAAILVDSGEFYWNAGLFTAKTAILIEEIKEHAPDIAERFYSNMEVWGTPQEAAFVSDTFPYCPNISFDYAVMEKSQRVLMLIAEMGWTDVGTWSSTYQLTEKDEYANATIGDHKQIYNDSQSNLVVINDPEKLVVLQGINNMLVVETDDVLLICRRGEEEKLRQVVAQAHTLDEKYTN